MKAVIYRKYGSPDVLQPEEIANPSSKDLVFINDFVKTGRIKSIIDRVNTLAQIAEAHMYAEAGHTRGKIIVRVAGES